MSRSPEHKELLNGSAMSNRQMLTACRMGRRLEFRYYQSMPGHEVKGYLVGMDSYHWLVAVVGDDEEVLVVMIHKSRPDSVLVSGKRTITDEPQPVQDQIDSIGGGFRHRSQTQESLPV